MIPEQIDPKNCPDRWHGYPQNKHKGLPHGSPSEQIEWEYVGTTWCPTCGGEITVRVRSKYSVRRSDANRTTEET